MSLCVSGPLTRGRDLNRRRGGGRDLGSQRVLRWLVEACPSLGPRTSSAGAPWTFQPPDNLHFAPSPVRCSPCSPGRIRWRIREPKPEGSREPRREGGSAGVPLWAGGSRGRAGLPGPNWAGRVGERRGSHDSLLRPVGDAKNRTTSPN